jgi:hypothetical protein
VNGPFLRRTPELLDIRRTADVTRPLTETQEPNRGNQVVLLPPGGEPDADGVVEGVVMGTGVDTRVSNTNAERLFVALGLDVVQCVGEKSVRICSPADFLVPDQVWPQVQAVIHFGTGNSRLTAVVDWLHGTVLSVPAETIRVNARYSVTYPPGTGCQDCTKLPVFRATATIGYGGASPVRARHTKLVQLPAPGDTKLVQAPAFATSLTILPGAGSTVSASLFGFGEGYSVPVAPIGQLSNVNQYSVEDAFVRFGGQWFVRVKNENTSGPAFAFLVFGMPF